ncbi:hypothetical protein TELCIR_01467 [Teladorsagia circumcincta]|uniref:Uncharacterized protein n=1 Tax=Teladorsagia circumcincta TaxID=45464 RepID=A0A2G9V1U0_TELCI|nr:hypothetical protein TELCIR_01467 [Teladorsagia circumcincta]
MSNDILDVVDKLNVELLKLSGGPGIKVKALKVTFPRLKTLVWDWSIVDPALTIDGDSKSAIAGLAQLFK